MLVSNSVIKSVNMTASQSVSQPPNQSVTQSARQKVSQPLTQDLGRLCFHDIAKYCSIWEVLKGAFLFEREILLLLGTFFQNIDLKLQLYLRWH